jgi:hypothetical protein
MGIKVIQLTLTADTATPTLVQGTGDDQFRNISGQVNDPLSVVIKNEDESAVVWWGGEDVDDTHGQSLAPGASQVFALVGIPVSDIPYVYSIGTPIVSVAVGRQ